MCLSLQTLTSIIKTGLPILVELIDLVNSVISNDLTQMVNFPTQIPNCDSYRNSGHVVVSVSNDFPSNSLWDVLFHRITYDYSRAYWDNLRNHLMFHGRISLNSVLLLLLLVNFVSGFRLELMYTVNA